MDMKWKPGLYWAYVGVILGLHRDNGKLNGNYSLGLRGKNMTSRYVIHGGCMGVVYDSTELKQSYHDKDTYCNEHGVYEMTMF